MNFTNNDPFGKSGGNLRIRGFDGSRVSGTFDGVPTNDTGNYSLFTNQILDRNSSTCRRQPGHHQCRPPNGIGDRRHGGVSFAERRRAKLTGGE